MMDYDLYEFLENNNCLRNINDYVLKNRVNNYGQEHELEELIKILQRLKKANALLVGKPGIGKTALIETLAKAINENKVPDHLKDKIIIELSLGSAVAGTKYRGDFEEKIQNVLNFIEKRDDVILFIDEIHNLMITGASEGAIGAGDMFKPFMARGQICVIGATTMDEYKRTIKRNKAMDRRFTKIHMNEPTMFETINIIKSVKDDYEQHYNVEINDWEIKNIVYCAKFKKGCFPDKALDALEDYCYLKGE